MSTALSEPFHFDNLPGDDDQTGSARHLRSVVDETLSINAVPGDVTSHVSLAGKFDQAVVHPAEEYAPVDEQHRPSGHSKIITLRRNRARDVADPRQLLQQEAIKKMTQTIGAAFIEAELGLRPFMQLSSWMELDLFHKMRARVEQTVNGKYLSRQAGDDGSKKMPFIIPIAVRAVAQQNGEWESSMTIRVGERARAIAMRLQLHRERWRVIAFEVG